MIAAFTETATARSDASKAHARAVLDMAVDCGAIGIVRFCNKAFMMTSRCRYQRIYCWRGHRYPGIGIREGEKPRFISAV